MLTDMITIKWPIVVTASPEISVVLTPSQQAGVEVYPDQSWFWTEAWQAMEAEADRDLAEGRYRVLDTIEEFLASLDDDESD